MNIEMPADLLERLVNTLTESTKQLNLLNERIEQLEKSQLLSEAQAQVYLSRDVETLRYYQKLGLEPFKKGKDRWYLKSDIDAWLESGRVSRHKR